MKDLRHHKKSMGMRAWQKAAAGRRGKYGDTLTIAQLRKDTRIPKSIMNDELLLEKANAFKERWAQGCIGAPLPVVNEAVVLIIGALWEVCGVREPTRELFGQIMAFSGANWLLTPYFEPDTTDNLPPTEKGDGQETHALH